MESEMKNLIQELEKAINEAIYESDHIGEIVGDMKRSGYDVCLLLETTIGLTAVKNLPREELVPESPDLQMVLTEQDQKFLEDLKIAVGDY